jgi:hypothetical protein
MPGFADVSAWLPDAGSAIWIILTGGNCDGGEAEPGISPVAA